MYTSVYEHGNQSTEPDASVLPHAIAVKWPCIIKQGQNVKYDKTFYPAGLFSIVCFYILT